LKALNNEIQKNFVEPLKRIKKYAQKAGIDVPDVRSEVRTGDTTQNKCAEMARRPLHILITTPESLYIILSTTKFREAFRRLKYVDVNSENLNYPEAGIIPSKYISRYVGKISLNNKRQIQSNGKISKSFCEMARMPFSSKSWETKGGMPFKTAASYFILRGRRFSKKPFVVAQTLRVACVTAINCYKPKR